MNNSSGYKRLFYIFQKCDKGSGAAGNPSGYVRILQNGPAAKALVELSDYISQDNSRNEMIFLFNNINIKESDFPVYASFDLKIASKKVSSEFKFDPYNIGGSGMELDDLWGIVICATDLSEGYPKRSFPLSSIKNEDRPWKNSLLKKMQKLDEKDQTREPERSEERVHHFSEEKFVTNEPEPEIENRFDSKIIAGRDNDYEEVVGQNNEEFVRRAIDQIFKRPVESLTRQTFDSAEEPDRVPEQRPANEQENRNEFKQEYRQEPEMEHRHESKIEPRQELKNEQMPQPGPEPKIQPKAQPEPQPKTEEQPQMKNPENRYKDLVQNQKFIDRDARFDAYFEKYDPFGTTNKAYRWWKCWDMHRVNEVLSSINIGLPFELNKDGYITCERHGHVIIGLYSDRRTSRNFVVLGIPAEDQQSIGNYHGNSRWENVEEGFEPAGYWLTYIDCETSNVVKATY